MARPQFTLRALLVAMPVVGAFFGGVIVGRRVDSHERGTLTKMILDLGQDNEKLEHFIYERGMDPPTVIHPDVETLDDVLWAPVAER